MDGDKSTALPLSITISVFFHVVLYSTL